MTNTINAQVAPMGTKQKLAEALRLIAAMTERHLEFEAAMASGDEQAVLRALSACEDARSALWKAPTGFKDRSQADKAYSAALKAHDAVTTAPVLAGLDNLGATVLATEVAEIAAASKAMSDAYDSVGEIDDEIEDLEALVEAVQEAVDEGETQFEERLDEYQARLHELDLHRIATLGEAGDDPLDYWGVLAKHGLMIPVWQAIHSYQQRMVAA